MQPNLAGGGGRIELSEGVVEIIETFADELARNLGRWRLLLKAMRGGRIAMAAGERRRG